MTRRLNRMEFKSAFSMNEYIRINHIDERDIRKVEIHGNDITLHYYITKKEAKTHAV